MTSISRLLIIHSAAFQTECRADVPQVDRRITNTFPDAFDDCRNPVIIDVVAGNEVESNRFIIFNVSETLKVLNVCDGRPEPHIPLICIEYRHEYLSSKPDLLHWLCKRMFHG